MNNSLNEHAEGYKMAAKVQTNIRLSMLTRDQLSELQSELGMTKPELVALAVDRLHNQEIRDAEYFAKHRSKPHAKRSPA